MKEIVLKSSLVIYLVICIVYSSVHAQEEVKLEKQINSGIRAIGLTSDWYSPSMDYWNNYFKDNQWANKFEGSVYYGGFFEVNIIKNLSVRPGIYFWKETVKSGEILTNGTLENEKLAISLTSISVDALYNLWFLSFEKFKPYGGMGGNFLFIREEHSFQSLPDANTKKQGQDFTGNFIIGIERPVIDHLSAGIEFQYVFGKFIQEVEDDSGSAISKDVSLTGPKIGITLSYAF